MSISLEHEKDIETIRKVALLQQTEIRKLQKRIGELVAELASLKGAEATEQLRLEIAALQEALDRRVRELYGRSSERRESADTPESTGPKAQIGHGPTAQPELPIVTVEHELDQPDTICPKCGGALAEMQGQAEESEEIDVIRSEYRLVKRRRKKYACRCGACVETAPGPDKLIPGGRYSIDFAVAVAVAKYADHLPLHRQSVMMGRQGLDVSSHALWDQLDALAVHLTPTYEALRAYVLNAPVVGADETTWPLLDSKSRTQWWAWSVTREDAVWYRVLSSRDTDAARQVLAGYTGTVVADGYAAYAKLSRDARARGDPTFRLAGCWTHARRKFKACEEHFPAEAKAALEMIGELYGVERRIREETAGMLDPDRLAHTLHLRQIEAKPIIKRLGAWMMEQRVLPQSGLGKAIVYTGKLWNGLQVYLDDPRVPIDNNQTEREMRPLALGRKNHYGSKSLAGTKVAALLYSLLESAKLVGLDPHEYLKTALVRAIRNPGTVTLPTDLIEEQQHQN